MIDIVNSVKQFTPTFLNIDNSSLLASHANMISTVDKNNEEAQKYKSDLEIAVANLPMNEKEDNFKANLLQEIENVTNDNASVLGIGTSYNALVKKYGDIMKSPAVKGRVEAQKAYTEFRNSIINNKDLSQDQKEYYLENEDNKYYYNDKFDQENGNIIGGTRWTPGKIPTDRPDYHNIFTNALKEAARHKYGNSSYKFLDENDNIVTDISKADLTKLRIKTDSTTEELRDTDLWNEVWGQIRQSPKNINAIIQDMEFARWYGEKHLNDTNNSNEELLYPDGNTPYGGYVNGQPVTKMEDFVHNMFNESIQGSTYKNTIYKSDVENGGTGYSGGGAGHTPIMDKITAQDVTTKGTAVEFDYKFGNIAQNNMINSKKTISNEMSKLSQFAKRNINIKDGILTIQGTSSTEIDLNNIDKGDKKKFINAMKDLVNNNIITNEQYARSVNDILTEFDSYYDNENKYNSYKTNISKDNQDIAELLVQMDDEGFKLEYNKNQIHNDLIKIKNSYFTRGNNLIIGDYSQEYINRYFKNNNLNMSNYGIDIIKNKDGGYILSLDQANDRGLMLLASISDFMSSSAGMNEGDNNAKINSLKLINNKLKDYNNNLNQALEKKVALVKQAMPGRDDVSRQEVRKLIGEVQSSIYTELDEDIEKEIENKIAGADFVNYRMFAVNDDNAGSQIELNDSQLRRDVNNQVLKSIQKKTLVKNRTFLPGLGSGVNLRFPVYDEKGNETGEIRDIFVPELLDSEARKKYDNDSSTKALNNIILANETPGTEIRFTQDDDTPNFGDIKLISNGIVEGESNYTLYLGDSKPFSLNIDQALTAATCFYDYRKIKNAYISGKLDFDVELANIETNNKNDIQKRGEDILGLLAKQIANITGGDSTIIYIDLIKDLGSY